MERRGFNGVASIWGHQRMKDGQPADGPAILPAANVVMHAPLQVSGPDYEVSHHPTTLAQVLKTERR
jgi:hypothetical protein